MLVGGVWVRDLRGRLPTGAEEYDRRESEAVERIVIHHVGGGVNRDYTAEEIANYHVGTRGWPGIAYHFLAHPDGRLEYVGDILTVRYHVGRLNASSIGICLAGDFNEVEPRRVQVHRVRQLCRGLFRELGRVVDVVGHRDVSKLTGYGFTECPGNTWDRWKHLVGG